MYKCVQVDCITNVPTLLKTSLTKSQICFILQGGHECLLSRTLGFQRRFYYFFGYICFCLLPTSVWSLTVLLPFWNLNRDKLIKWKNVVVERHESFRKMAHAVCISFSLSDTITYIFVPGLHPLVFMFLQTFDPLIQFYVLKGSVLLLHSLSALSIFVEYHTGFNILETGQKFNLTFTVSEQSVSWNIHKVLPYKTYLQLP